MNRARLKILVAENGAVLALIALVIVLAFSSPRFLQPANIETIIMSMAEIGLVAIPMAFLVMSGSIDLSVGSVASLAAVVSGMVAIGTENAWLGLAAGILVGLVTGAINALLIEYMGLNALVVTLGFMNVWAGTALLISDGATFSGFPVASREIARFSLFGAIPIQIALLALATIVGWWVLNRRPFGRQTLAAGGNSRAAFLMGINVRQVRTKLFIATAVGAALAGVLLSMRLQASSPSLGAGMEFNVLIVVLLGGVAFEGGHGRISGVIAGLLFVGAMRNGLVLLGVNQFLQTVITGATLVLAMSLDSTVQRVLKNAWTNLVRDGDTRRRKPPANGRPITVGSSTATAR